MAADGNADRARIYVSFADEDRARAMELVRWLNDSGWHVEADDRHSFELGETWTAPRRLAACDVIVCVITPGWLVSTYCHHEFAYSAKRGRFVLPVICELSDLKLLPPAIRALPRVDLTRGDMVDYLALKQALTQAGTQIGRAAQAEAEWPPDRVLRALHRRRLLWLAAALLLLIAIAAAVFRP